MSASEMLPLLEPIRLNRLELANRMVMGPMAVTSPDADGMVSEQTLAFFDARAKGGVGMIIVGGSVATSRGWDESPFRPVLRMDKDEALPGLRRLGEVVHACGVPIIAELTLGFGRMGTPTKDRPNISASPLEVFIAEDRFPRGLHVPGGRRTTVPEEATIEQIETLNAETVDSALRMQKAGWDGIELAAHMSYFAASFLSPRTNWRTDKYGGEVEDRARLLADMVREIRERAGPEFVIGIRITSNEYVEGGQDAKGYAAIAAEVERAGLDYVALAPGCYESMGKSMSVEDGDLTRTGDAQAFREVLSVPILLLGFHDPANAARAIQDGHADLVMLARPLLADPEYANKVATGRPQEITRCDRENLCVRSLMLNMPPRCAVNPQMGREAEAAGNQKSMKDKVSRSAQALMLKATGSERVMSLAGQVLKGANKLHGKKN